MDEQAATFDFSAQERFLQVALPEGSPKRARLGDFFSEQCRQEQLMALPSGAPSGLHMRMHRWVRRDGGGVRGGEGV